MVRPDAIILGAGAAGLEAARMISESGGSAVVLEARGRIGGRIFTIHDTAFGAPVELGAEFIHGRPEPTWKAVRRYGMLAYDLPFDHWQKRAGRLKKLDDFSDEVGIVMKGLARLRGPDISFAQYMRTHVAGRPHVEARRMATAFVEGFDAADAERISARSLAEEQEGVGDVGEEPQFRLADGYGTLIDGLRGSLDRRRVPIRLETIVSEVRWKRGAVEVLAIHHGKRVVFRAKRCIITLPLGVLQLPPEAPGAVRFVPELPEKRRAMNKLASGPVVKAVLTFRTAFWEEAKVRSAAHTDEQFKDMSFLTDPDAPFPTFWTARPLRLPMLTAWAGGPKALKLSGLGERGLVTAALASLGSILHMSPRRLQGMLVKAHAHDWPADPFAHGAYSYVTVGGSHARRNLAAPVQGTLFFAGEATDTEGQASTVAGALGSGARAGREALRHK